MHKQHLKQGGPATWSILVSLCRVKTLKNMENNTEAGRVSKTPISMKESVLVELFGPSRLQSDFQHC